MAQRHDGGFWFRGGKTMSKKRIWALLCSASLISACGSADESSGTDTTGNEENDVLPALVGDFSCFEPGQAWLEQTLKAETGTTVTSALLGVPLGGDDGEYSAEVDLSFWYDNSTDGEPDATGVTGNDGILTVELPSCQPLTTLAVRTIDTELTYKANFVIDPESPDAEVTVVESLTAASIKAILNESTSETSSLVAGTIYDCNQDPVLNARARVKDATGAILSDARDYYFNDASLPTRRSNRSYTNTDGRWVVFNLPVGPVTIEVYGNICEGEECTEVVLGTTDLTSIGDSVNIGNVFAGIEGGVYYPQSCLQ